MTTANILNVFGFPLHGQRLIEASAGTGKTYTIAGLFLRLLLGHGDTKYPDGLPVDQILVVTFTDAATQELKDRIRKRIHQARRAFEIGETQDEVLQTLLASSKNFEQDRKKLLDAERQMDEAAIHTIHSFCQRMLKQNAFESGSLFVQEIITDQDEIKLQATADFWRKEFYDKDKAFSAEIRRYWECPKVLLHKIKKYLAGLLPKINAQDLPKNLQKWHEENIHAINKVKQVWLKDADEIETLIAKASLNGNSFRAASVPNWLRDIKDWASAETLGYELPPKLENFATDFLVAKTKKGKTPPSHQAFDEIQLLLEKELNFKDRLTKYAIKEVRAILAKEKSRHSWLSFDDLLSNLNNALNNDSDSELAKRIRALYPIAMIDEFQDTDPEQYNIFSTIYANDENIGLFMIGDPKQAIYAFRGADIFTYIKARQAVKDHYNLDTNWRSTAEMVSAANRIFEMSDAPFIYDEDIPFLSVNSSKGSEKKYWQWKGEKQPALTFWLNQEQVDPIKNDAYLLNVAEATAVHIRDLLIASDKKEASFCHNDEQKAIKPRDIAVLVRTGQQADLIKKELAKRGIASVYLSDRNSVFSSMVAKDIERILHAVLLPENERTLRAALASSLFDLTAIQIDELNNDEKVWELALEEFKTYQEIWFKKGVQPMLAHMVHKRKIAQRLLEDNDERQLTDLMHISELLQQESKELDSHYALIRWLKENIEAPNGNSGAQQVRLESERDLVQIVTIHKSKGLEYNLVYLPFVCSFRETDEPFYHDEEHQAVLDLLDANNAKEKAEKERLAEDLRLLYVAITRAVYGCVLGMASTLIGKSKKPQQHRSAIGYLLHKNEERNNQGLKEALHLLVNEQSNMKLCDFPAITEGKYTVPVGADTELTACEFKGKIERNWRLSSYSGLVKQGHKPELDVPAFDIDAANDESEELKEEILEKELPPFSSIFQFPKGARPGTFIHTLFENISFAADMQSEEISKIIQYHLVRENYPEEWIVVLQKMLSDVVCTRLNAKGIALKNIDEANRLNELEFMMLTENLSAYSLNALIKKHDVLSAKAGYLDFKTVSGMVKGFIDLVFCFEGKYYVLDWKSNFLGDSQEAYTQVALENAMIEHRYDFQYQIYTLALHRFLRSRIPDYCYEKHIGGVFYLFVRGMEENSTNGIFHTKLSKEFIEELDALFVNGVQHAG